MSLKLKSALLTFGSAVFIVVVMGGMIYGYVLAGFQTVENQRAVRSLKSLKFALNDKLRQLESKLGDWAVWDDTYKFMTNKNQEYINSNLVPESFAKLGVDEVLFISNNGALHNSFLANNHRAEDDFPQDVYPHFATGSALVKMNKNQVTRSGIVRTPDGILLFSVERIYKSDGTGPANGVLVFMSYFDSQLVNSIKELTQSDTQFVEWEDKMPSDFREIKEGYTRGIKEKTKLLNQKFISDYFVIEDAYGKPQGILRIDIIRDVTLQGKKSMISLMVILFISGLICAVINFWLMTGVVLKKVFTISTELKNIGDENNSKKRLLTTTTTKDELDVLRVNINTMLEDIEESQKKLRFEMGKQESILELIDASVVILDPKACVAQINRKGYEALGYSQKELIGVDWIEHVILPEQRDLMKKKFDEIMSSNMTNNSYIENSLLTKDKKVVTYAWHNTIIKDSKGVILSTVSVGTDITVQKQEEKVKEDYITTLKRLNKLMVGRELKMIELKEKLKQYETA